MKYGKHECEENGYNCIIDQWLTGDEWCMEVTGEQESTYLTICFCPFCGVELSKLVIGLEGENGLYKV